MIIFNGSRFKTEEGNFLVAHTTPRVRNLDFFLIIRDTIQRTHGDLHRGGDVSQNPLKIHQVFTDSCRYSRLACSVCSCHSSFCVCNVMHSIERKFYRTMKRIDVAGGCHLCRLKAYWFCTGSNNDLCYSGLSSNAEIISLVPRRS
jgi:hypothetical protein